jgi:hypothetical protein
MGGDYFLGIADSYYFLPVAVNALCFQLVPYGIGHPVGKDTQMQMAMVAASDLWFTRRRSKLVFRVRNEISISLMVL